MTKKNSKEEDHVVSDEMSQLQHELEMLKTSNTALTAENERLMKEAEQFAESLAPTIPGCIPVQKIRSSRQRINASHKRMDETFPGKIQDCHRGEC